MLRGIAIGVFVCALASVCAGLAHSHARLTRSVPAADATTSVSPPEVRLQFNEPMEARFSKITVEAKGGKPIAADPVSADPADKKILVLKLKDVLQPGSYQVSWRVVSLDTHKISGGFTFQVKR